MSEWISIDEKKPDIFYPNKILVVVKNVNCSFVAIAGYFDDYKDNNAVTHWMPLPEPPEVVEEGA